MSESSVWLNSEPDQQGQYHLYLEFSEDDVVPLANEDALLWAREVLAAVRTAEHDAGIIAQWKAINAGREGIELLGRLRADRGAHIPMTSLGMELVPGVTAAGKPFVRIERKTVPLGQWGLGAAKEHALVILMAMTNLDLDSAYFRVLISGGIGRDVALAMVADLGNHGDEAEGKG